MTPDPLPEFNPYTAPEASIVPLPGYGDDPLKPWIGSLGWRFVAFLLDYLLFVGATLGLGLVYLALPIHRNRFDNLNTLMRSGGFFLAWTLVIVTVYFGGMDSSRFQGTVGKLALGLKVTNLSGQRISFVRASLRSVLMVASIYPLFQGLFTAILTARKQTIHDLLTRTVVLKRRIVVEHSSNSSYGMTR